MRRGEAGAVSRRVAVGGLLFALALVLSVLEGSVGLFVPIPGVRLGLSNIVVIYCVFLQGPGQAYLLGCLKALFVLLVRGMSGALFSLTGGVLSITVMLLLLALQKKNPNYTLVSMAGGAAHNLGQLACSAMLLGTGVVWYYFPALIAAGVLAGALTAVLLRILLPAISHLGLA